MNEPKKEVFVPEISGDFSWNVRKYPREQLLEYAGQWIAWNLDGTQILGHGTDEETVRNEMIAAGLNPDHAVWDRLDPGDGDAFLGAGAIFLDEDETTIKEE